MTSNAKTFEAGSYTTELTDFIMCSTIFFIIIQIDSHDNCLTPIIQNNMVFFNSFFLYLDNIYIHMYKNIYAYFFFLFFFLQFHVIYKTGQQNNL